jgi:hypothetical protein
MKKLLIFLVFLSMPVLAQERIILSCNVDFEITFVNQGVIEKEREKGRIQIDIERHNEGFGFSPWYFIRVGGSHKIDMSFGSPPKGKIHKYVNGKQIRNRSTNEKYDFWGEKNSLGSEAKDPFHLEIDRVTGLVDGGETSFYGKGGWITTDFIGICKVADQAKRLF